MTEPIRNRPKIATFDLSSSTYARLREEGHNVQSARFGIPYQVLKSDEFVPVIPNSVPADNLIEQDILIVDLYPETIAQGAYGAKVVSHGEPDIWASCYQGFVDPRPRVCDDYRPEIDRVIKGGGILVVFAAPPPPQQQIIAKSRGFDPANSNDLYNKEPYPLDCWSFSAVLENLQIKPADGEEVSVRTSQNHPIYPVLNRYASNVRFECTIAPGSSLVDSWQCLAANRFEECVGGMLPDEEGLILIFPQVNDKPGFLADLMKEVLPELKPELFPNSAGKRWLEKAEYEAPVIINLKAEIERVQREAEYEIETLEQEIETEREKIRHHYDLLTSTGDPLVAAVKECLEEIGFEQVVDVDEESDANRSDRREDLRILDRSPILIAEVKGMAGLPKEEDAMAVRKYLMPRGREWNRNDLQGLTIINHQRNIPALERQPAFTDRIKEYAEDEGIGLLSTWELFKLLRGFHRWRWEEENLKPVFYKTGIIEGIPEHYEYIGRVEKYREIEGNRIVGVRLEAELNIDDRIAFLLPNEFYEQDVESLQIENEDVEMATRGDLIGTTTGLSKKQAVTGVRVFKVRAS